MTHHYIHVNGIKLHYTDKPGISESTIIFLHGRSLSAKSWTKQFESEKLSFFRLIALDFPGHGLSDHCDDYQEAYSFSAYKNLLIAFIFQLKVQNYVVAGLSLGGHIALQALSGLKNCKGVFAMTMPVTKPIQMTLMYQNPVILGKVFQENPSDEDLKYYISLLLRHDANEIPSFIEESFYITDPKIHEGIMNGVLADGYDDEVEVIKNAKVPIAILAGSEEQIHDLSYLDNFDLPVWRKSYQMVPAAGHLLAWENPEYVNSLLKEFALNCFD